MLLDDYLILEEINEDALDRYLSEGYYRMNQNIFTTDAIFLNEMWLPVFWLRVDIHRLTFGTTAQKIAKMNKRFTVSISPMEINEEINTLYELYKSTIAFNGYESVSKCLNGDDANVIFKTQMMQVRDGEKLIAVGYFDCGREAVMGILNFYHPDYKKYSLGKFLMLQKLDYIKQSGRQYYYTGYFSTRNPKFDYKFFPDVYCMQVYLRHQDEWIDCSLVSYQDLENDLLGS
jgi:arginyl-tRNA--protein-N-Asp/Glu arginylyltransferase